MSSSSSVPTTTTPNDAPPLAPPPNHNNDASVHIERVRTASSKSPKILLHDMQLDFPQGAVVAILGPSGSGKTTLMNTITNNVQSGVEAIAQVHLQGQQAFVPQDDRLAGFFTCKSYLRHYLRLTGQQITESTEHEMDALLTRLGLQEQADTIVGDIFLKGLSGGQKRRLSVALEALTRPKTFVLDEPTSGLDAESALQLLLFLRSYAQESPGRHVILTIHQPSSHIWQLIDHVVLLSKGKLMYQGPRDCMEDFFQSVGHATPALYNPADHYVTIVNDEFQHHAMEVDEWADRFQHYVANLSPSQRMARVRRIRQGTLDQQPQVDIDTRRSKSPLVAVELTRRYFLNLWFNPGILGTRIAMYAMLALGVGALFWDLGERTDFASIQTRAAVLFYCVAFFIFMSVAVLPFTVMERAIVDKEVRNGYYNPIWYQLAQGISTIPGAALLAGLTTLIIITMTKLSEPGWYFLTMFLSLLCAEALAQMVSHVVPHFVIGMALIAGMYGFFMLFQGFMLIPSDFPNWLSWTYYVPFHTYAWRTFMYSEFINEDSFESEQFPTGLSVLEYFEIEDTNRGQDMVVLACYTLIIHIISCTVLHAKYNWFHGKLITPTSLALPTSIASPEDEPKQTEEPKDVETPVLLSPKPDTGMTE